MSAEQLSSSYSVGTERRAKECCNCKVLKEQCTAALRQWDKALRECNEAKSQLWKVQQQRDEAMKQINEAMNLRIKATKDLTRLTEERNAAVHEYSLVMSERDSVHKEIEKLQEELQQCQKRIKVLEQEQRAFSVENESLKREVASLTREKEELIKAKETTYPLRSQWGSSSSGLSSQGQSVSVLSFTNLNQSNEDYERLRLNYERLRMKNEELSQQLETAKRQYEWAFCERDKIVLERESIRVLCDKYRRERDRAVSDLAEALMDSDDIKRQRNEASKELKDLKDQFVAHFSKETINKETQSLSRSAGKKVKHTLTEHNKATQQSLPAPTLLDRAYNEIFGSQTPQAKTSPTENNEKSRSDSIDYSVVSAQSKDKNVFDYYKSKTGKRVVGQMSSLLSDSPMPLSFTVEWLSPPNGNQHGSKRIPNQGDVRIIFIEKSSEPLGIQIKDHKGGGGIFVSSVNDDSIAAKTGLRVGDQLLEVCGINMRNATYTLAANVLRQCGDSVRMLVQYNPHKYKEHICEIESDREEEDMYNTVVYKSCSLCVDFSNSFYGLRLSSRKSSEFSNRSGEF
ncbi:discs large protein-like protein [Leptotrombidium deliense]|uniref:Discs large protein-like protein n=1 Tax=Leptotrombidium deliense TaxID=299467 RepID=A0A443S6W3_9ACAR|nr:discs large protein-like protein [Leptotrombidium deliense]